MMSRSTAAAGWRLREWRRARGQSLQALADAIGTSKGYVSELESGKRRYNQDLVEKLAGALDIAPGDLIGRAPAEASGVPMIGHVGAGGEGHFEDAYELGAYDDLIDLGGGRMEGRIALIVSGDSMAPVARDKDIAIFGPKREDLRDLVGREVMARVHGGGKLFKILRKGDPWTLSSWNPAYPDIEGQRLDWALPFEMVIRTLRT